jgi:hypothetical protein
MVGVAQIEARNTLFPELVGAEANPCRLFAALAPEPAQCGHSLLRGTSAARGPGRSYIHADPSRGRLQSSKVTINAIYGSAQEIVEEHDVLHNRVALDAQFVGREVRVGIADRQAADDRKRRRG